MPTCQHPAGIWSSGTCHHHGLRAATPPRSHPACRDPLFLCPLPALLPGHPLFVPACQRDLNLLLGVLLLPHPQPVLAPLRCNTNHLVPAGHREPQNPSHFFWEGVLPACPTTSGLGAGEQHGGHSGSGGLRTAALFLAKSTCPLARHRQVSPVMAAGDKDGGGVPPPAAGRVDLGFHCMIIMTMLFALDFSIKPSAQPHSLAGEGRTQGTCVTRESWALPSSVCLVAPSKITWCQGDLGVVLVMTSSLCPHCPTPACPYGQPCMSPLLAGRAPGCGPSPKEHGLLCPPFLEG